MADAIQIPSITIHDGEGRQLLCSEAFTILRGSVCAITGPSGAGKSLLISSLFKRQDQRAAVLSPQAGDCLMIQDPAGGLTPYLSVRAHFAEIAREPDWEQRALNLLAELGLQGDDILNRDPGSLSGGERQRVMLGLALFNNPRVLVCDEPAASIDPENEVLVWDLLDRQHKERGLTLIFVTHSLSLIERYAQQVVLMDQGEQLFNGSKVDFFQKPTCKRHQRLIQVYQRVTAMGASEPYKDVKGNLLRVDDLYVKRGGRDVLANFSWEVGSGEWWWILGRSGSGKTTLAKSITGLVKPHSGSVSLGGRILAACLKRRELNDRLAMPYLFQHGTNSFNPVRTVDRQLRERYRDKSQLLEFLRELNLQHLSLNRLPASFSVGEIQRLNLIRGLARKPQLLICDELLAPLNLTLKSDMVHFLDGYRIRYGTTILVITHDLWMTRLHSGRELRVSG